MRKARQWGVRQAKVAIGVVLAGAAAWLCIAGVATAWACVSGPTMNVNPDKPKAGQEVTLSGFNYSPDLPIVVHWNALNGPVLGTFTPAPGRFGDPEFLVGKVTIPVDAKAGPNILIATQSASDGSLAQVPVRAVVTVTPDGGGPLVAASLAPAELGRPVGPVRARSSVSAGALVLVALGTVGVAMFIAGMATFVSGRRRTVSETAPVVR